MGALNLDFFAKGLAIGFAIAAPVGPIGILCIKRTLENGKLSGLVSGLGAATADAVYGSVAVFGLSAVSGALMAHQVAIRIVGGVFLCYLGATTFFSQLARAKAKTGRFGLLRDYGSTFLLTLTNPATILSFAAIFAGLGIFASRRKYDSAAAMVAGVFLGSAVWWLLLSAAVGMLHSKLDAAKLRWINRLAGSLLLCFGLLVLRTLF